MRDAVIVTGATGFIGAHLVRRLCGEGERVVAVVRPGSPRLSRLAQGERLRVVECPLEEMDALPERVGERARAFYHLAWAGTRPPQRDDPAVQRRMYRTALHSIRAAARLGCERWVGAGSQAEYGVMSGLTAEDAPLRPAGAYGEQKVRACAEGGELARRLGLSFVWARIFSLYGPLDAPDTLVSVCVRRLARGKSVELSSCAQRWDYLHVRDAARALALLAGAPPGIYNVASGDVRPLRAYVTELHRALGGAGALIFGAQPGGPGPAPELLPDVSKLRRTLGWTPEISFPDGIRELGEIEKASR